MTEVCVGCYQDNSPSAKVNNGGFLEHQCEDEEGKIRKIYRIPLK